MIIFVNILLNIVFLRGSFLTKEHRQEKLTFQAYKIVP